jgi:hypothetical protein
LFDTINCTICRTYTSVGAFRVSESNSRECTAWCEFKGSISTAGCNPFPDPTLDEPSHQAKECSSRSKVMLSFLTQTRSLVHALMQTKQRRLYTVPVLIISLPMLTGSRFAAGLVCLGGLGSELLLSLVVAVGDQSVQEAVRAASVVVSSSTSFSSACSLKSAAWGVSTARQCRGKRALGKQWQAYRSCRAWKACASASL